MLKSFFYRAKDINGDVKEGTIDAVNMAAAANQLRKQQLFITKLTPKTSSFVLVSKVQTKELALFCRQLATLLSAGVPILSCLNVLSTQLIGKQLLKAIGAVSKSISNGYSIADAMRQFPGIFPNIVVSMVEVGEHGGRLDTVLDDLADYLEREQEIREKLKAAIIYPVFVLVLAAIMVMVILVFVLPSYVRMLSQFNLKLPLITQVMVNGSNFMIDYWYLFFFLVVVLVYSIKSHKNDQRIKAFKDIYLLRVPIIGKIYNKILIARFCRTLALLLRSGVPLLQALSLVRNIVDNRLYVEAIDRAQRALQHGETLAGSLGKNVIFHQAVIQMIAIGERDGKLEQQLLLIATVDEKAVNLAVSKISPLLEPALLLITSVVVGIVMIAVMLPIFRSLGAATSF